MTDERDFAAGSEMSVRFPGEVWALLLVLAPLVATPLPAGAGEVAPGDAWDAARCEAAMAEVREGFAHVDYSGARIRSALDTIDSMREPCLAEEQPLELRARVYDLVGTSLSNFRQDREGSLALLDEGVETIVRETGDHASPLLLDLLRSRSQAHYALGHHDEVWSDTWRAMDVAILRFGEHSPEAAEGHLWLSNRFAARAEIDGLPNDLSAAEVHARAALAIYEEAAPASLELAGAWVNLREILRKQGRDAEAEEAFRQNQIVVREVEEQAERQDEAP